MGKLGKIKGFYAIFLTFIIVVCTIGSTYAYLSATVSGTNDVRTSSSSYSVSMRITPIYDGFSMIPMDDFDVLKAVSNGCKDKYNRGACNLYNVNVYGYDSNLDAVSGSLRVSVDNINNLSFMALEESNSYQEGSCAIIDSKNYCISNDVTHILPDTDMSFGDSYNVFGMDSKNILLVFWLTNLNMSQNLTDIGSFNASVTILLGRNGGQISGNINCALNNDINILQSEE